MEKYSKKETEIKLAEIKTGQPPEFLMTEQELKDAVINNLPKPTICPKHNCQMEIFSGTSSKTGEPYRAYRCGISGCKEILWTDREAETINAEVKDIEAMLGIESTKDILPGQLRKEKNIERFVDKKQNSMRDFAVKRDATMFAVAELSNNIGIESKSVEAVLKELHEKWLLYFETIYGENGNE